MATAAATIAAIATPPGTGGIGVVRISGTGAFAVAEGVFRPADGGALAPRPGHTLCYGRFFDADGDFDDGLAAVFHAPASYTGEDVVELSGHGSVYLLSRLLSAAIAAGARLAEPGEFTRRAFLAGKLSLTQAEAVMELISAAGLDAAAAARARLDGGLARAVDRIADGLADLAAHLAAWIDFPDEEADGLPAGEIAIRLAAAEEDVRRLLDTFRVGELLQNGVPTAIVGRPNVGKSTLMNWLSGAEKSIVTAIPGTTRDVVESEVLVGGFRLKLADTAGLRDTADPVERLGVDLARRRMDAARLVLLVLDASEPLTEADRGLLAGLAGRPAVAVVNKTDLPVRLEMGQLAAAGIPVAEVSACTGAGVERLSEAIRQQLALQPPDLSAPVVASARQRDCLARAGAALTEAGAAVREGQTLDAVSVLVEEALDALLEMGGGKASETVIDRVFANFCVGK